MYDHPIKQAGLSMNRIIFSNTMMVMGGFPNAKAQQFSLSFKYKTFENGKNTSTQCKYSSKNTRLGKLPESSSHAVLLIRLSLFDYCRLQC